MSPHWLTLQIGNLLLAILSFLASPTGGREIGNALLQKIGLRGSGRKRR